MYCMTSKYSNAYQTLEPCNIAMQWSMCCMTSTNQNASYTSDQCSAATQYSIRDHEASLQALHFCTRWDGFTPPSLVLHLDLKTLVENVNVSMSSDCMRYPTRSQSCGASRMWYWGRQQMRWESSIDQGTIGFLVSHSSSLKKRHWKEVCQKGACLFCINEKHSCMKDASTLFHTSPKNDASF